MLLLVGLVGSIIVMDIGKCQSSLQCDRFPDEIDECPSATTTEQECNDKGCYYCDGDTPSCVQGTGCSWINMTKENECKNEMGRRIFKDHECFEHGCSWCKKQTGFKCFKNPTSRDEMIVPPLRTADNCPAVDALRVECDYLIPERAGEKIHCAASGCHWCADGSSTIDCLRGQVCSTQKSTGEYDCRNSPTEVLSPYQCLQRGCSWCENNDQFKCVRDTPVGISDLNCERALEVMTACPDASANEQACRDNGCYYCSGICYQGAGCSWIDMSASKECKTASGASIEDKKECRDEGCSWCDHHTGIKCFKNPTSENEIVSDPQSYSANCDVAPASRTECQYVNPDQQGTNAQCWISGCHWCLTGLPTCMQGTVCDTQRTGTEYDCRDTDTETLTPYQCGQRGCSWCEDNVAYKCVRDEPDGLQTCPAATDLFCFPFSTPDGVTAAQCEREYRCSHCPDNADEKQCMRGNTCPPGYQRRYDQGSCCRTATNAPVDDSTNGPRVIGGVDATEGQWPSMVYYTFSDGTDSFNCGAFIVSPKIAITAAHCQLTSNGLVTEPGTGFVTVGSRDRTMGVDIQVAEAIPFPYYVEATQVTYHDIMVLKLLTEVPAHVKPVSLPLGEQPLPGTACYATGWGIVNYVTEAESDILQEAKMEISSPDYCTSNDINYNPLYQICASDNTNTNTVCSGDSGGALFCQRCKSCEWYAVGIVSYSANGCPPSEPAYFARVEAYQDFLQEHGVPVGNQVQGCDPL